MILVYSITNTQTGKVYVGYTSKTLAQRKSAHKYEAFKRSRSTDTKGGTNRAGRPLYVAIREWGWSAFTWRVLTHCENVIDAFAVETSFILYYRARSYNATSGCGGTSENLFGAAK